MAVTKSPNKNEPTKVDMWHLGMGYFGLIQFIWLTMQFKIKKPEPKLPVIYTGYYFQVAYIITWSNCYNHGKTCEGEGARTESSTIMAVTKEPDNNEPTKVKI